MKVYPWNLSNFSLLLELWHIDVIPRLSIDICALPFVNSTILYSEFLALPFIETAVPNSFARLRVWLINTWLPTSSITARNLCPITKGILRPNQQKYLSLHAISTTNHLQLVLNRAFLRPSRAVDVQLVPQCFVTNLCFFIQFSDATHV